MAVRMSVRALLAAFVFASCSSSTANFLSTAYRETFGLVWVIVLGLATTIFTLATLVSLDIWRLKPADSHTLSTLYSQYRMLTTLRFKRPYHKWVIWRMTKDPIKTSENSLLRILKLNKDTEYGQKYNFEDIKSREDFIRMHPLTDYEHYREYINRTIDGEENIIIPHKLFYIGKSSGTTAVPKLFPYQESSRIPTTFVYNHLHATSFVHLMNLKRHMWFYIFSPLQHTACNIPCGITSMSITQLPIHNLTPAIYSRLHHEEAAYYVQALFSLAERELQFIQGFSADLMHSYLEFIDQHQDLLCDDIERGVVGVMASGIPEDIRQALSKELKPNPIRAAELRVEFYKGADGLVKRIWKDIDFVGMSSSASFKMCSNLLMETYLKGVKSMIHGHGATEGLYGTNFESEPGMGDHITLANYPCFTEFIAVEDADVETPRTLFSEQLELGKEYEIVVSTENGLYRYRTSDVMKVTGFTNNTPKYEFMYRLGQRLSIIDENTPEHLLYEAMMLTGTDLPSNIKLMNYTTTESLTLNGISKEADVEGHMEQHYVGFVDLEVSSAVKDVDITRFMQKFDDSLMAVYSPYAEGRAAGQLGKPRIIQVRPGTFSKARRILWRGQPNIQFKFPRVLRNLSALEFMYKNKICNTIQSGQRGMVIE